MKLTEIKGDLFAEKYQAEDIYAHCISEDFVMGKGIAKTFKQLFPELKAKDRLIANYKREKYKRLLAVPCKKALVGNLITKRYYYNKPTYETLEESLAELKECIEKNGIKRILMPRIGCGLDGLKWEKVKLIIEEIFADADIEILVFYF